MKYYKKTQATEHSCHFSCSTATTDASNTLSCDTKAFSKSMEEIHSPPLLIQSFVRSAILIHPSESTVTMSPV